MYDWNNTTRIEVEPDFYISSEVVDLDKAAEKQGDDRKYPTYWHSIDLTQVELVKFNGKLYRMRETRIAIHGPIPRLVSGKS
jgi:hypothetical protein